jgi:hypothetical protein
MNIYDFRSVGSQNLECALRMLGMSCSRKVLEWYSTVRFSLDLTIYSSQGFCFLSLLVSPPRVLFQNTSWTMSWCGCVSFSFRWSGVEVHVLLPLRLYTRTEQLVKWFGIASRMAVWFARSLAGNSKIYLGIYMSTSECGTCVYQIQSQERMWIFHRRFLLLQMIY